METVTAYAIRHKESGNGYVGATIKPKNRWKSHRAKLRKGGHHCHYLQAAWDKYGEDAFEFLILEVMDCETKPHRTALELKWIFFCGQYNSLIPDPNLSYFTMPPSDTSPDLAILAMMRAKVPGYALYLKKRGEVVTEFVQSVDGRANMAAHAKRRWADPELRKAFERGLERRWSKPNARAEFSQKMTPILQSEAIRDAHTKDLKEIWSDPERSAKYRAARANQWDDPERRKLQSEKLKAAWARRKASQLP